VISIQLYSITMVSSRARKPDTGSKTTTARPSKTRKPTTKPRDENRVSKSTTTKATNNDKGGESRRAKDANLADKARADMNCYETILKRGPNGPPVYDVQGFELDYAKVLKARRPISKSSRGRPAYMKMLERESAERSEIEKIVGLSDSDFRATVRNAVQDRVAKDLGVPWHKVGVEQYREWKRLGFKIDPEEFKTEKISEEEKERLLELSIGSAFRK
jgi:hypothetical protein